MNQIIVFNKPFRVLSQFRAEADKITLAQYFHNKTLRVAGRLDYDSEGLLLLTNNGKLQHHITHPRFKLPKTYWVQIEGIITQEAIDKLSQGVILKDGLTLPAIVNIIEEPTYLWKRDPPIRYRAEIPTSWIEITIYEGRNRQIRRMTAAVGYPALRLIRYRIGDWTIKTLLPGQFYSQKVDNILCNHKH